MAFESSEDLVGFFVFAFADQKTGRIRKEWTESVNAEREENLESEWKSPCYISWCKGKTECKPIGYGESSDAICCLG